MDNRLKLRRQWATIAFWVVVISPIVCIGMAFFADTETVERLKMMEFILGTSLAALIVLVHKYFTTATEYDSGDKG